MFQVQVCLFVCNLLPELVGASANDSKWLSGYYQNNELTTGHGDLLQLDSPQFYSLFLKKKKNNMPT